MPGEDFQAIRQGEELPKAVFLLPGFRPREVIPADPHAEQGVAREKKRASHKEETAGSFCMEGRMYDFDLIRADLDFVLVFEEVRRDFLLKLPRGREEEGGVLLRIFQARLILLAEKRREGRGIRHFVQAQKVIEMPMRQKNAEDLTLMMLV